MDKYWKKKWVEALRSGEYKQGKGHLRNEVMDAEDTFCCLGVLCDIIPEVQWVRVEEDSNHIQYHIARHEDLEDGTVLPRSVASLVGFPDGNPDIMYSFNRTTLAEENDKGMTFEEIADLIEEQF